MGAGVRFRGQASSGVVQVNVAAGVEVGASVARSLSSATVLR